MIARSFLEEASGPSLTGTHSGKIAVVLEEADTLSPDEFVEWRGSDPRVDAFFATQL